MNGHSPRSTSGSPKAAVSEAITRSQPRTSPTPPARHRPWTEATTGTGQARMASTTSRSSPRPSWTSSPVASGAICTRSAPEQKTRSPALVSSTTRASPTSRRASRTPRSTSPFRALRLGSRSTCRRSTPPSRVTTRSGTSVLSQALGGGQTTGVSLVLAVLAVGLLLGWLAGGTLDRLGAVALRRRRLVLAALVAQALGTVVGGPAFPLGLVVSALLITAFLAANRGLRGTGLVALGLLANALVVGANGAMPVSRDAVARAGVVDPAVGADVRHEPADATTVLPWLGDVVPVALPVRPEVVSPGDVLVAAGLAQLVVVAMLARPAVVPVDRQGRQRRALPPVPR